MDKRLFSLENRSDIFTFSLFSPATRVGYAVMLLCIGASSVLMYSERHQLPILGIILSCFSLFVLCYVDRWSFNCSEKTIEYRIGFVFFALRTRYLFSDVERTETEHFIKGIFKTQFVKCVLCLCAGEKKTIAIFPARNKALERQWETLTAIFTG